MRRFSFDAPTSLSTGENILATDVKVYPNPADHKIFLDGFREAEITTIDGRKTDVKITPEEGKLSADISPLIIGTYVIKGKTSDGKVISKKLIKK